MVSYSALARRHVKIDEPSHEHLPYLWAAYRRGVFNGGLREGLSINELGPALDLLFHGRQAWVLSADTKQGVIPIGIVTAFKMAYTWWPHVVWFPEATPRTKMETIVRYLETVGRMKNMVIVSRETEAHFFRRCFRYARGREIGMIMHYNENGNAILFQTNG